MTINCQHKNNSLATIGERIKFVRKAKKLTQTDLADKLELTQGFIGHIENGRNQPTLDQITRIAIILDCNMTWLATGEGEREANSRLTTMHGDRPLIAGTKTNYLDSVTEELISIMASLDKASRQDVLKYAVEKQQLSEFKKGK